jgi:hypothetical protein
MLVHVLEALAMVGLVGNNSGGAIAQIIAAHRPVRDSCLSNRGSWPFTLLLLTGRAAQAARSFRFVQSPMTAYAANFFFQRIYEQ